VIAAARLATAATATAVGIALALAAQGSPASATEQPAGALLSLDSVHFSATPSGSLFPAGVVLIPGATADATFWVRNESAAPADLRIAISHATASTAAFVESLTLQAATAATPAVAPVPLSGGDCTPVLTGEVLAPGATTQVHVVLAMSSESDNAGQGGSAGATLAVSLSEETGGVSLPPNCSTTTGVPVMPSIGMPSAGGVQTEDAATTSGAAAPVAADAASASSPAGQKDHDPALPTLAFGGHPALLPGALGGLAALAAGAVALALILRKRRAQ
jgi:hypothetical protein